jgi:hypothetical protein
LKYQFVEHGVSLVFFGEDVGYIGVASYVQDIDNAGLLGILDRYLAKVKVSQFL